MDSSHRRTTVAFSVVGSLVIAALASCSTTEVTREVDEVSASENYTTVTGSLVVGDPFAVPRPTEVPSAVITEPPVVLDGARYPGMSPVGVTDVVLVGSSAVEYRLAGNGPVAYTVRYVDEAVRYATSEPVAVPGQSVLQVDLSGASTESDESFDSYAGPERIRAGADSAVVSVDFSADPGGISQSFIGVGVDRPEFTVTTTAEPAAVIVTIAS
ncbi:MAG: AMIN-like domain-containing (lipo)protein [Rhodococcus sp. (in: high G+C Gram-positive bacteria)]